MKADIMLLERVLNLIDPDAKQEYVDQIWDMLSKSYSYVGGYKGAKDKKELIYDSGIWKIIKRGDHITAFRIYKDSFGRKGIASGTNQTKQGTRDFHLLSKQDLSMKTTWSEVSDKMEDHFIKLGAKPVSNTYVKLLLPGKKIELDDDGYHYYREIMGTKKRKMIVGFPKIYD